MSILHNIFFFILAIGVLVTFHEFGHYWVARKMGVKVLRFSIGFGKPLVTWRKKQKDGDEIDYIIAAIPLGGYVKMLDERETDVSDGEKHRAFNNQTLAKRAAIVLAGPLFNFLLAIALYMSVFMLGVTVSRPIVGDVVQGSAAQLAGFQLQDEVLSVGKRTVKSWGDFRLEILNQGLNNDILTIKVRDINALEKTRQLNLTDISLLKKEGDIFLPLGLKQWLPTLQAQLGNVLKGSAAEKAGLQKEDIIIKVEDEKIDSWMALVKNIQKRPNQNMPLTLIRAGKTITVDVKVAMRKTKQGEQGFIGAGVLFPEALKQKLTTEVKYNVIDSFIRSVVKTGDISFLTLRVFGKMITGEASLANISGPITIATFAGLTASAGLVAFLSFLAAISISLGVLNLLPVPMLDGGHLFYYLIELVKGSPVSELTEMRGQQVGIALLIVLMSIAFFNDIQRLIQ